MKASDYRQMGSSELQERLGELKRNLFDLKTQSVTETVENSRSLRNARRDIARILTVMQQKK
ncbi:MAG: 50S ribosomal protein L29 [Planctomycetes bacterium]|nr:50S ribosomal protein L29 [Planctomycetota bacterium]